MVTLAAYNEVVALNKVLLEKVAQLEARIIELEARLNKNSGNSNKPPSSDWAKKRNNSLRGKSGRATGGQPGHPGQTLKQVEKPDYILKHGIKKCEGCGYNLNDVEVSRIEKRQVFDIPKPKVEVTEHQAEVKECPHCRAVNKGVFPARVKAPVQYGERALSLGAYLSFQQLIPEKRNEQIFKDVFGLAISSATLGQVGEEMYGHLEPYEKSVRGLLKVAPVLHADETGELINKKLGWLHAAVTEEATLYWTHEKRGIEGMQHFNLYENFEGVVVHDGWKAYFRLNVLHALCNVHHRRELQGIEENYKEPWAAKMSALLLNAHKEVENQRKKGKITLTKKQLTLLEGKYDAILKEGFDYHASRPVKAHQIKKRGRKPQEKGKNLLDRLKIYKTDTLLFLHDFRVPFTNNQAERDLRMMKLKQKISGCFRSQRGAVVFSRIRGYISTAKKQGWNILDAITQAINGQPFLCSVR